ncbi:MAG TPA: trehalose-6-phosphate synthase [Anaerolineales bacterium]|nr:trehalose-6-phosphate synthase [Anaerolineales bacterium]
MEESRGGGGDMKENLDPVNTTDNPDSLIHKLLAQRTLIIASNRGPVTLRKNERGDLEYQRGSGGLVTALAGVIQHAEARWIACAQTEEDKAWAKGDVPFGENNEKVWMQFLAPSDESYEGYYRVIANPLLWFLQHSMWDIFREPTIDQTVWSHWENGYVAVNMLFAEAIAQQITAAPQSALVMLQDYHLYLAPSFIRYKFRPKGKYTLVHFVHIPWPGAEDWGFLPVKMRRAILEGLCAVDLLGFQTREDGLNFIRTCESHLPGAHVNYREGRVWFRNHATYIQDFPISIDVDGLRQLAETDEVNSYREQLLQSHGDWQIILRIDRIEPSKNIVRGFQAFSEMLELYPEHRGKVKFVALLVPSRLGVSEYGNYLDEVMGITGRVNAKYGGNDWEPVRILVDENYPRAVAALQIYDLLLVNSIADGMNLVAKEGPIVNRRDGVLVLSERTGAYQQLESGVLVISPLDVYGTAEAMHQALTMPMEERGEKAQRLRSLIESQDIVDWLRQQLSMIIKLNL